jgi:translation initiation factor 4A
MDDCNTVDSYEEWDQFDLQPYVLRGIYAYGFEKPSLIQQKTIRPILEGKDVIVQAQSGTGKTGCFTISTLSLIDTSEPSIQAILLSPTRELAMQTKDVLNALGKFLPKFKSVLAVGGTSLNECIQEIHMKHPQVVVGCSGRIYDLLRRNVIVPDNIKLIIIDEADEMMSDGFKEQMYNIFQYMSTNVQVGLFSATLPDEIVTLFDTFMRNPVKILVKSEQLTLDGISQYYINLEQDNDKYECLKDIYSTFTVSQCIIYCNSVQRVQQLYDTMLADHFPVTVIHSNMDKLTRTENYKHFRSGKSRVLISSNVTARGIDIQQVSTVINFDIPSSVETYLHRIGRSGRWGRKGLSINFVTPRDTRYIQQIERHYSIHIQEMPTNWDDALKE